MPNAHDLHMDIRTMLDAAVGTVHFSTVVCLRIIVRCRLPGTGSHDCTGFLGVENTSM